MIYLLNRQQQRWKEQRKKLRLLQCAKKRCLLLQELQQYGLDVKTQCAWEVTYKGHAVGEFRVDLVVNERVIIELKCVDRFAPEHMAQCINYLKASRLPIALLLNFKRSRLEWKRVIVSS